MSKLQVETISHTNNTTAVSLASDGRTTFTTQPQITTPICFQASRTDSGGTGKNGTIIFNNAYVNLGGGYSTSTGKFTAPINGTYHFNFHCFTSASNGSKLGSGSTFAAKFQVDSSDPTGQQKSYVNMSADNYSNVSMDYIVTLSASQDVLVYITDSYLYSDTQNWNQFSGRLIG
jgi:VCBS repeat-containing protein